MTTTPDQMRAWRERQRAGLPAAIVYYCYDADDAIIYVGSTRLPVEERLRLHAVKHAGQGKASWTERVARTDTEPHASYADALAAEEAAVRWLDPPENIVWTSRAPQTPLGPNGDLAWRERAKVSNRRTSKAQRIAEREMKVAAPDLWAELYEWAKDVVDAEDEVAS